jgi:putative SOS response-associated peptidase YedK
MCGRFDTSKFTWREIHDALASFIPVKTAPLNLEASADPTTSQLTARIDGDGWALEKMRWGLVPFWRNGKPLAPSPSRTLADGRSGLAPGTRTTRGGCFWPSAHTR